MHQSELRYKISSSKEFQDRVLVLAITLAHSIMNTNSEHKDIEKFRAKAVDIINQPEQYRERLALSVAALLEVEVKDVYIMPYFVSSFTDEELLAVLYDVFDALAGVPRDNSISKTERAG